ncbi:MAG: dTMP kinase [SAR202 cluster bacterium Io17-Chloro-G3]|nr:MAG: dTMP kinase [SAR202 cluster bacterium Io17-Chloro-G3]
MGVFIVLEGGDGSGKTTQAKALYRRLLFRGYPALLTQEPGGTVLGERVRRIIKGHTAVTPLAWLFLFSAARAQLLKEVIHPALEQGVAVVCDRYTPSTIAYQGYGHGLELATVRQVIDATTNGFESDIVVFLDSSPDVGLTRKKGQNGDRFDSEDTEFHNRVRHGYLDLASKDSHRWMVVDAGLPIEQVADQIWERVAPLLASER